MGGVMKMVSKVADMAMQMSPLGEAMDMVDMASKAIDEVKSAAGAIKGGIEGAENLAKGGNLAGKAAALKDNLSDAANSIGSAAGKGADMMQNAADHGMPGAPAIGGALGKIKDLSAKVPGADGGDDD